MAWASIARDATWLARLTAPVLRPAAFVYLDWPTDAVRASTLNRAETVEGNSFTGVGHLARIEGPRFTRGGALVRYEIGLQSLPIGSVDDDLEAAAIGRRAIMWLGLFDEGWGDLKAERVFVGHVRNAGKFKFRHDDEGNRVVDSSLEISNGRNPRRSIENHHSPETAEGIDTAWRLLPTAGRVVIWPTGSGV